MVDSLNLPEGILETFDPGLKRAFQVNDEIPKELRDPKKVIFQPGKLKVSGDFVFYTLQGEGITMGYPAVFMRLKICNLRCVWCDAFYTWNPKSKEFWTEGEDWDLDKAESVLQERWKCMDPAIRKRVVFTGGEPLLQKKVLEELMKRLHPEWVIEIETNGTIMPTDWMLKNIQFNCSPKLRNSQNLKVAMNKPDVIKAINKVNSCFKFVVTHEDDLDEIEQDYVIPYNLDKNKVTLMPQGVTPEEIRVNMKKVAEKCKEKGYRLLSRLQVEIWGARRRV